MIPSVSICSLPSVATSRSIAFSTSAPPPAVVCLTSPPLCLALLSVVSNPLPLCSDGVSANSVTRSVPLLQASGNALPFADSSFDAVCEISTLHHVPNPSLVLAEMLRVARRSVIIVDSNRHGQGSFPARLFKLFLFKPGLWYAFDFLRTRGKRYQISEGDGLFYSYSVYDSYDQLARWADRILLFPPVLCFRGVGSIPCSLLRASSLSPFAIPALPPPKINSSSFPARPCVWPAA